MVEQEPSAEGTVQDPIADIVRRYELSAAEKLILLLSIAPYYFGGPRAMLAEGQEVDIERYAQEIVAKRDATSTS